MTQIILFIIQPLLLIALAPLFTGIVRKTKARLQNRRGASVFQPYWALVVLFQKSMTIPEWSTWVYHAVPIVVMGTAITFAVIVPAFAVHGFTAGFDNVFILTGILALGAVFLVFGGMDTGSTFGNMGSSREMTLASIIEPTLFLSFGVLGALGGTWGVSSMIEHGTQIFVHGLAPTLLGCAALILAALLENARYPVDNPATHLELTMVHEAMVLEYGGPYLALLEWASMVKLMVFAVLITNIAFPLYVAGIGAGAAALGLALLLFFIKYVIAACGIGLLETLIVKMRFYRMQEYALLAFLVAMSSLIAALVMTLAR